MGVLQKNAGGVTMYPVLIPQGFKALRSKCSSTHQQQFRRLLDQCQIYEKEILPSIHPRKSITYYGMAAANLSLCYKLTGQKRYLKEARRWIFTGVRYPHWGVVVKKDVDLSAAWLLFWYGACYDWLRNDLSKEELDELRQKLLLQGERMYQYAVENEPISDAKAPQDVLTGGSWVTSYWQNHNWIDFAGLAMAGYVLCDGRQQYRNWTELAKNNFHKVISLLAEDGSDYEGVVYWRYGVIWLFLYSELLREREGEDLFKQSQFMKNTFYYRLYQCVPDLEQNFNFGDCHDRRSGHSVALYYKIAHEYQNGYAQWLADYVLNNILFREGYESGVKPGILPEAFLELLWYDPEISQESVCTLPTSRFFPDLGLFSIRTSWEKNSTAISCKCSSGGGKKQWNLSNEMEKKIHKPVRFIGHHHPDANSFLIVRGSDFLTVDEGYSNYKQTCHHNVILVDGKGFEGDGMGDVYRVLEQSRTAKIECFLEREKSFYLRGEASQLYRKDLELTRLAREFLFTPSGVCLICDEVISQKAHVYTFLLHAENTPLSREDEFIVENGSSRLRIHPIGDLNFRYEEMEVSAYFTSQEPDITSHVCMQTLCIENRIPAKQFELITLLSTESIFDEKSMRQFVHQELPFGFILGAGSEWILYNRTGRLVEWAMPWGSMSTRRRWTVCNLQGSVLIEI